MRKNRNTPGRKIAQAIIAEYKPQFRCLRQCKAAVFAVGSNPEWNEERDDYNNQTGFSFGRIFGIKKSQFKFDEVNWTDFGVVNVLTASEDD